MFVEHVPDDRGQAHTLEAFVAALLLVAGLIFATQATAVTPLSASTSNQHIENQQAIAAADVLSTTKERGDLKAALLLWDPDAEEFRGSEGAPYTSVNDLRDWEETAESDGADGVHPLRPALEEAFDRNRIAFNVEVRARDAAGDETRFRLFDMGEPSDNAATASTRLTFYEDDRLYDVDDGHGAGERIGDGAHAYGDVIPRGDADSDTLYTVVEVRITAWQM